MMKLNSTHIEAIRKYFLAGSGDEQSAILQNIQPVELADFILQLNHFFLSNSDDIRELKTAVTNIDIEDELNALQQLQQDYYTNLAALHHAGTVNREIETLFKLNKPGFINEVAFQNEIATAFRLNERALQKTKFIEIDKETEPDVEEITLAFKLKEREQLKKQFQQLETGTVPIVKTTAPVIKFNWKKLAIAATITGIILATTFVVLNKNNNKDHFNNTATINNKKITDSISELAATKQRLEALLAKNIIASTKEDKVLKEPSLGFGTIDEKVSINIYNVQPAIAEINNQVSSILAKPGFDQLLLSLKLKADFLTTLINSYTFNNDSLNIYIAQASTVKIYKIKKEYYIKYGNAIYECEKSAVPLQLKQIKNKDISDRIEMIN